MPAYRSEAEAEIRTAVVERLRELRPNSRIIHEINVCELGNRVDVLAVGDAEIIAVEIKSSKDNLDRLPAQAEAMNGSAHFVIAALHEKFLVEQKTNEWAAHYERGGEFYLRKPPKVAGVRNYWIFPEVRRATSSSGYDHMSPWVEIPCHVERPLPEGALDMLWRAELYELCGRLGISVARKATMDVMIDALRWYANGGELTRGICTMLRARKCIEADPPIMAANDNLRSAA